MGFRDRIKLQKIKEEIDRLEKELGKNIPKELVWDNIKAVEEGKPLTVSLAKLNGFFKKEYFERNLDKKTKNKKQILLNRLRREEREFEEKYN